MSGFNLVFTIKKTIMKPQLISLFAVLVLLQFSCKKENERTGIDFNVSTTGRTTTVGRLAGTTGTINWTSGYASAREIEFEAENENTEVEYKSSANQRINLFNPLSSLGFVNIPPGTYKEVEFEIHLSPTPPDAALELKGLYNAIPIVFRINTPLEIEAEFEDVTINQSSDFSAMISLNLALLTRGITDAALANATLTNGEIVISSNSNTALYNIMINNFKEIDDVELDD